MDYIRETRKFTTEKLAEIRGDIHRVLKKSKNREKITIVATGSYGREEASSKSDIDHFIIYDADEAADDAIKVELEQIEAVIKQHVPERSGSTGTFGKDAVIQFSEMKTNIGGEYDDNKSLTRRMLFLLEGTWLYGEDRFERYQRSLLKRYMENSSEKAELPRFLLNDVIRYYRTIATDFEHKVFEDGKEWGLRSIKLRFSRKILYFGGILTIAEMADAGYRQWEERAIELFGIPVLSRIERLIDDRCGQEVLEIYDQFLAKISDPEIREALKRVEKEERTQSEKYQTLRQLSVDFSAKLSECLDIKYSADHSIHHALLF